MDYRALDPEGDAGIDHDSVIENIQNIKTSIKLRCSKLTIGPNCALKAGLGELNAIGPFGVGGGPPLEGGNCEL